MMKLANRMTYLMTISAAILTGFAFQIKTVEVERVFRTILQWFISGSQGGAIIGPARFGKTSALRWALKTLQIVLGVKIPIYEIPMRRAVAAGERDFFEYLLVCLKHRDHKSGTASDKRNRVHAFLSSRGQRTGCKSIILWFDEAQWLTSIHHDWLINISNELVKQNVRVFFLFSGTSKFAELMEEFVRKGEHQFTARHLSKLMSLRGVGKKPELKRCLEEFEATVYPQGSKKQMPDHFKNATLFPNFCLSNCAARMWKRFEILHADAKIPAHLQIPMHYVTAAMLQLLQNVAFCEKKQGLESLIDHAVDACGFTEYLECTPIGSSDAQI